MDITESERHLLLVLCNRALDEEHVDPPETVRQIERVRVRLLREPPAGARLNTPGRDTAAPVVEPAPPVIDLLTEAATHLEDDWEGGAPINASDLVEWFAEWRIRARTALGLVETSLPLSVSDPEELRIVKAALEAYGDDKDRRSQAYVVAQGVLERMTGGAR
jgi:hypothetical protein